MTLKSLTGSYDDILKTLYEEEDDTAGQHKKFRSWKLQEKLIQHYKDRLVLVTCQQVRSGVLWEYACCLCNEGIKLPNSQKRDDCETTLPQTSQSLSETQLLHRATYWGKAWSRLNMTVNMSAVIGYHVSNAASIYQTSCMTLWTGVLNQVPTKMAKRDEDTALKICVIAICHDLFAQCCHIHMAITLGLAIHHEFGINSFTANILLAFLAQAKYFHNVWSSFKTHSKFCTTTTVIKLYKTYHLSL